MSKEIIGEIWFLTHSLLLGIGIIILYDCLRILRNVISHMGVIITLEDILYWIVCAFLIFRMLYNENDGIPRWFSVGGIILGMLICQYTISELLVRCLSLLINKVIEYFVKVFRILTKPFVLVGKKTGKGGKKVVRSFIKRLKKIVKTIRIGLYKH